MIYLKETKLTKPKSKHYTFKVTTGIYSCYNKTKMRGRQEKLNSI